MFSIGSHRKTFPSIFAVVLLCAEGHNTMVNYVMWSSILDFLNGAMVSKTEVVTSLYSFTIASTDDDSLVLYASDKFLQRRDWSTFLNFLADHWVLCCALCGNFKVTSTKQWSDSRSPCFNAFRILDPVSVMIRPMVFPDVCVSNNTQVTRLNISINQQS